MRKYNEISFSLLPAGLLILILLTLFLPVGCAKEEQKDRVGIVCKNCRVSYAGSERANAQDACERFFGKNNTFTAYESEEQALQALFDKEADYAVIENPDILITHTWISVVGKAESETGSFYFLSVQKPAKEKADRLAFVASGRVQNLPILMAEMTALDMNPVSIHDLSAEKNAENSDYIIELSGSDYDSFFKLKQKSPLALRYLGTFYVL